MSQDTSSLLLLLRHHHRPLVARRPFTLFFFWCWWWNRGTTSSTTSSGWWWWSSFAYGSGGQGGSRGSPLLQDIKERLMDFDLIVFPLDQLLMMTLQPSPLVHLLCPLKHHPPKRHRDRTTLSSIIYPIGNRMGKYTIATKGTALSLMVIGMALSLCYCYYYYCPYLSPEVVQVEGCRRGSRVTQHLPP